MNIGADCFGISKKWLANRAHFTFNEIKEVLSISRLLGGHMLFPRNVRNLTNDEYIGGLPSVNTARGGRPMFDRTDLFLVF
ncbi:hypothetical protein [Fructobacillus evanidus]|uniref:hypothetical protein n=1 Tax=Fructobacillus evanidus TaxID=3064281 RepID=UPI0030C8AD90